MLRLPLERSGSVALVLACLHGVFCLSFKLSTVVRAMTTAILRLPSHCNQPSLSHRMLTCTIRATACVQALGLQVLGPHPN